MTYLPKAPNNRRALTFLEVMLLFMLISSVVLILQPRVVAVGSKAPRRTTQVTISSLSQALDTYKLETGAFPTTEQGLRALIERPANNSEGWDGPYLAVDALPKDGWGRDFVYRHPPERGANFDLFSLGRDGQAGTEDDIVNWSKKE